MKEPILVIMAAGMGSRYGGLKQLDPLGPDGEVILDYSLFDARRAGFRRVVFLIKHEIEEAFRAAVGSRVPDDMEANYAFQQLEKLPEGFSVPQGRTKPWGTGHAVLCCRELLDAPFLVINADDYYGVEAFRMAYEQLKRLEDSHGEYFMVGYELRNTLTESGYVSRGVCEVDEQGFLTKVTERTHIIATCDGPMYTEDQETYHRLPETATVSMNCWGFTPDFSDALADGFVPFLKDALDSNPMKAEYYLPSAVSRELEAGHAAVRVLTCPDRWWGVTYHEDRANVMKAMRKMAEDGLYPSPLWGEKESRKS